MRTGTKIALAVGVVIVFAAAALVVIMVANAKLAP